MAKDDVAKADARVAELEGQLADARARAADARGSGSEAFLEGRVQPGGADLPALVVEVTEGSTVSPAYEGRNYVGGEKLDMLALDATALLLTGAIRIVGESKKRALDIPAFHGGRDEKKAVALARTMEKK